MAKKKLAYGLRTVDKDGKGYGGFQWPKKGHVVAPDWKPDRQCGHGLHALLNGEGNSGYLYPEDTQPLWQVIIFDLNHAIDLHDKIKVPECEVLYTGTQAKATQFLLKRVPTAQIHGLVSKVNDGTSIKAGDRAVLTAGNDCTIRALTKCNITCGVNCTVTVTSGTITTGDNCHVLVLGSESGTRVKVGNNCRVETSGYADSHIEAGDGCTLRCHKESYIKAGDNCSVRAYKGALICGANCYIDALEVSKDYGASPLYIRAGEETHVQIEPFRDPCLLQPKVPYKLWCRVLDVVAEEEFAKVSRGRLPGFIWG